MSENDYYNLDDDVNEEDLQEVVDKLLSRGNKNDKIMLKKIMYEEEKKKEMLIQGYINCEEDEETKEYITKRNEIIELWEAIKDECEEYNDIYNKKLFKNLVLDELYELIYGDNINEEYKF
jgi:hypothetical protein